MTQQNARGDEDFLRDQRKKSASPLPYFPERTRNPRLIFGGGRSNTHYVYRMQLTKHWAATLDDYAIDLGWSPDGQLLAAASAAGSVYLYGTADGALRHQLPGHEDGTNCLAWQPIQTPDAGRQTPDVGATRSEKASAGAYEPETRNPKPETSLLLATGGQDGAVKFWDALAGQHTATAKLGSAWVEHLAWRLGQGTGDGRQITGSAGGETGATSPQSPVSCHLSPALFAAAGRNLVAIKADASIAHTFKPAPKTISALAMQPAGGCVAAAYFGGVVLWDTDDFIAQKELPYANGIHALVWSPDSRWLVSGNQDPSVHLWIPEKDEELHMSGYETKVKFLSFDHTSRWLATSGGRDGCVWDCSGAGPEGREPAMLPHDAPICAVKFQHAHGLLATASEDGVVQLWSPERRQPLRATVRMPNPATKLAWSPDDGYLAIGTQKGAVYVLKCEA